MSASTLRGDAAPPSFIALLVAISASSAVIAIAAGTTCLDAHAVGSRRASSNTAIARAANAAIGSDENATGVARVTGVEATGTGPPSAVGTSREASATTEACAPQVAVVFAHGRTTPPSGVASQLAPIVAFSQAHPDRTIVVDGHADPSGTELENLVLSKRRARHVAGALVRAGIPGPRIVVRAFGAYVPVVGEPDAGLRRVQVAFHADPCRKEAP